MANISGFAKSRPAARGPRPATAQRPGGPKAQRPAAQGPPRPAGPVLIFHGLQNGRRWVQFSAISIFISVLFNLFFRCLLLSGKRRHSLFIRLCTEPDRGKCILKREYYQEPMMGSCYYLFYFIIFKRQLGIENVIS